MNEQEQLPLRDIHLPDAVAWWPPAPGWWLAALIVVVAAIGAWWWFQAAAPRRRANRLRKAARAEFDRLEVAYRENKDPGRSMQELSMLLRRIAMTFGIRNRVAGLSGDKWVGWLKATDVRRELDSASLQLLADGPYRRTHDDEIEAVIHRCRRWLDSFDPEAAGYDPV
jgi:hypothetical protein